MKKTKYVGFLVLVLFLVVVGSAAAQTVTTQWQKSKHANKELAVDDATWEGRQATAAHCGRCHSEQGFKAWLPQLLKGDSGLIKKADGTAADEAFIKSLGLTKDQVKPITCTACHSQGSALRIQNNIPSLPNGLAISAVGKGALCMACHNTRNGRIAWDTPDPKRYTGPHEAAQTDVIMGKNVFFYNDTGETASPHAVFTGDACVSCHKQLGTGGHTFKPGKCSECHGVKFKEAFVQSSIVGLLKQLEQAIEKKVLAVKGKIVCVTSWNPKTDKDTPNTAIDGTQIKAVAIPTSIHGQISLKFIMQDGKEVYSQLGNIKDACGEQGKPVFATADPVVRALWNYLLFEFDGSKGVHNPTFARNVLTTTINVISK
jgi:cytochrome c553